MGLIPAQRWSHKCNICGKVQIPLPSRYGILWVCPNEEHRSEWVITKLQKYQDGDYEW